MESLAAATSGEHNVSAVSSSVASLSVQGERQLIATISGKRSTEALPVILEALASCGAQLADMRQFVVQDDFTLTLVFDLEEVENVQGTDIVKELLVRAHEAKLFVGLDVVRKRDVVIEGQMYVVTMISQTGVFTAGFLRDVCGVMAEFNGNIETINSLSHGGDGCASYEFFVRLSGIDSDGDLRAMRERLLELGKMSRGDIAIQRAGLLQRAKRVVVFDMSYTLIRSDAFDVLLHAANVAVPTALTSRHESGEIDDSEYLRQRVALLRGIDARSTMQAASAALEFTTGAATVMRALRRLGFKTAVISRGPRAIAEEVKYKLGMDFAYGNDVEVLDGAFSGALLEPVIDAERKSDLLQMLAMQERVSIEQIIAVGDGPVSRSMLSQAGLSVAFDQPKASDGPVYGRITSRSLTSILYLLGFTKADIEGMSTY